MFLSFCLISLPHFPRLPCTLVSSRTVSVTQTFPCTACQKFLSLLGWSWGRKAAVAPPCSATVVTVACSGTRQDTQLLHKNDTRGRIPENLITTLRSWSCQDSNFPRRLFTLVPLKSIYIGVAQDTDFFFLSFLNSVGGECTHAWVCMLSVSLNSNQARLFVCLLVCLWLVSFWHSSLSLELQERCTVWTARSDKYLQNM